MLIPEEQIEEIRARANFVEIVGGYTQIHPHGKGMWKGLCPFHSEKTASFSVDEERKFYVCFGCGASGDLYKFIMEQMGVSFHEAVRFIGDTCGVEIKRFNPRRSTPIPAKGTYTKSPMAITSEELQGILDEMDGALQIGGGDPEGLIDVLGTSLNILCAEFGMIPNRVRREMYEQKYSQRDRAESSPIGEPDTGGDGSEHSQNASWRSGFDHRKPQYAD
jgi:hypothetical protein